MSSDRAFSLYDQSSPRRLTCLQFPEKQMGVSPAHTWPLCWLRSVCQPHPRSTMPSYINPQLSKHQVHNAKSPGWAKSFFTFGGAWLFCFYLGHSSPAGKPLSVGFVFVLTAVLKTALSYLSGRSMRHKKKPRGKIGARDLHNARSCISIFVLQNQQTQRNNKDIKSPCKEHRYLVIVIE